MLCLKVETIYQMLLLTPVFSLGFFLSLEFKTEKKKRAYGCLFIYETERNY